VSSISATYSEIPGSDLGLDITVLSEDLFHLPTLMDNSLFIKNMYVTLQCSKHIEHCNVTYIFLMNKELCIKVGK
jgi:hypothetical protein